METHNWLNNLCILNTSIHFSHNTDLKWSASGHVYSDQEWESKDVAVNDLGEHRAEIPPLHLQMFGEQQREHLDQDPWSDYKHSRAAWHRVFRETKAL